MRSAAGTRIPRRGALCALVMLGASGGSLKPAHAQSDVSDNASLVARLWIQASDGAVRHRDLVKPSLDSLIAMGAAAVPVLLPYLATEDARERHAITDIFQGIGKPAVAELVRVLGTGDLYHTLNSLTALAKIGDSSAALGVIPFLGDSAHAIRAQAAETLGKTGGRDVNEALLTTLRDSVESVRKSAAVALGRRRHPGAADALAAALDDTWFGVRYAAAEALVQLDSGEVSGGRLARYAGRPLALVLDAAAERRLPLPPGRLLTFIDEGEPAVARAAARLLMHAAVGSRDRARAESLLARTTDPLLAFYLRSVLARPAP